MYNKRIIKPILNLIEKNQEYLTKPENLDQLAKLGFMFENFYYAGRTAYGYQGVIKKGDVCENNPKYEIGDNIDYVSEEIEDLIYDAWGMHVSDDRNPKSYDEVKDIILNGVEVTEFMKKSRKRNKTFDEWVEVLTHTDGKYKSYYKDRRDVANHLLCVIGNGYGYNHQTGTVLYEASGADQDIDIYGFWENAKFRKDIQKVVDRILSVPELKIALDVRVKVVNEYKEKRKKEELESHREMYEFLIDSVNTYLNEMGKDSITIDHPNFLEITQLYVKEQRYKRNDDSDLDDIISKPKFEYYPISNYSIITKFDENTHPSYIHAALEICNDIVTNPPEIKENFNQFQRDEHKKMIEFANKFINKYPIKNEPIRDTK